MTAVNADQLYLMRVETLPNGELAAMVRINLPDLKSYRVYSKHAGELWRQVTPDLVAGQVERWWAHRAEPKPVHMVTAAALDAEVDALRKAAGW